MTPFIATSTLETLGSTGSNVFNAIIQAWIQLMQNSTLVVAVIGFAVVGYVLHYIKRKVF